MEYQAQIKNLLARSKVLGLSTNALCSLAGVPAASISRWLTGANSPTFRTFKEFERRLEKALTKEECKSLAHLERLHPQCERGHGEVE